MTGLLSGTGALRLSLSCSRPQAISHDAAKARAIAGADWSGDTDRLGTTAHLPIGRPLAIAAEP